MHCCNDGIGSGRRLLRSLYGKLKRTTSSPRLRISAEIASTPRSFMFPPAPCAHRNVAVALPVVATSNAADTAWSPTRTVHDALGTAITALRACDKLTNDGSPPASVPPPRTAARGCSALRANRALRRAPPDTCLPRRQAVSHPPARSRD